MAYIRHELHTLINAILGYSEMLLEDIVEPCSPLFLTDLQALHTAGSQLLALVNEILDTTNLQTQTDRDQENLGLSLRHALLTPVSAVIVYCELLIEEATRRGEERFIPDLRKIHSTSLKLLAFLEDLIHFPPMEGTSRKIDLASSEVSTLIQGMVTAIRPLASEVAGALPTVGGSLLIVDDDGMSRDMLSRRLQREGYTVTVAENGHQALEMIPDGNFDLVLLDLVMPEMNGYQVLEHLKADPTWRHLPVLMLSSLDELDSIVRCIEIGAEDFLAKPFNQVLLKARVGASLERKRLRDREVLYLQQVQAEKERSDALLHMILPGEIAEELQNTDQVKPRRCENVAVLFCDIVGFTDYCQKHRPEEVIAHLQQLVEKYEDLVLHFEMEKIKTIGDGFMATAGLLMPVENPVLNSLQCGLEMLSTARNLPPQWEARVGIHVGPVIAGVVGHRKFLFDIWGDTVNIAARVEHYGKDGFVNVSRAVWDQIADQCHGEHFGLVEVEGKEIEIFQVHGWKI